MSLTLPGPLVRKMFERVLAAHEIVEQKQAPQWDRNLSLFRGNHWGDVDDRTGFEYAYDSGGMREVTINWTRDSCDILFSNRTAQDPKFSAVPVEDEDDPTLGAVIGHFITKKANGAWRIKEASESATLDSIVFGTAISFSGWKPGRDRMEPKSPEVDPSATDEGASDTAKIEGQGPVASRVSPYNFLIDPEVHWDNIGEAEFMGQVTVKIDTSINPARSTAGEGGDGRFMSKDAIYKGGRTVDRLHDFILDPGLKALMSQEGELRFVVRMDTWWKSVEIKRAFTCVEDGVSVNYPAGFYPVRIVWDMANEAEPLLVELWPYELRDEDDDLFYPFTVVNENPQPGSVWGRGIPDLVESQQLALNDVESARVGRALKIREKWVAQKGTLGQEGITALQSTEDGVVVEVNSMNPATAITPLIRPNVVMEWQEASSNLKEGMNFTTGVNDAARGAALPGDQTATEARLIAQQSTGRSAKASLRVEDHAVRLAMNCWSLQCQFRLTGEHIRYSDPNTPGPSRRVQIDLHHLAPVKLSMSTGASRISEAQQKMERIEKFIQIAMGMLAFWSPMNPTGYLDPEFLMREYVTLSDFTSTPEKLFDVEILKQKMMAEQAAMAPPSIPLGGPLPPGGPGGPPPLGLGGPSGSPGPPLPQMTSPIQGGR